ncbi:MAG: hypothetical protein JNK82_38925 [Myxococcaceae bacterium]|nr:hypothetical protein [Myxococcaceae bacterium]
MGVNAGCFALLAWLYGGDLYDVMRASSAEVSALTTLPSVPFAAALLALTVSGGALTVFGLTKKHDQGWKGYRVMPIIAVVGLFVDLFVVSADKPPFSSFARATAALELFENKASALSTAEAVPTDRRALEGLLAELGEAPWLVKGQPLKGWALDVGPDCEGPRTDARGAAAGTLLYCAAFDRSRAWVTAVGLPREERFGAAQLVTTGGEPVVGLVQRQVPENAPEAPMYFDADAGNLAPAP